MQGKPENNRSLRAPYKFFDDYLFVDMNPRAKAAIPTIASKAMK